MNIEDRYQYWTTDDYFDQDTKNELMRIKDNKVEIEDRFYMDLAFGTGGLRGVIGAGTNRMNIYTVRKATQGLANYILEENGQNKGVAIAFDSRNMSPEFAEEAALCLCANGIRTYLFESLRPTPELSFALRELGCIAGIVVTASHNPSEYNGYKVYWEDGAQITYPKDKEIIERVGLVTDYATVRSMKRSKAEETGLLKTIGKQIDDAYLSALKKIVLNPEAIKKQANKFKIVYTPLHGTGNLPVRRILEELGLKKVYVVPEQELPDGDFPTVSYPNPEDKNAFKLALDLAKKVEADIVLATDPDADRLGIYVRDVVSGEFQPFTGNMLGMIILEYILSQKKEKNILPNNGAVVTTIVSGNMADAITKAYQVKLINTLTGFKYIGEQIKFFEQNNDYDFLFGFEESYGCLVGTHARDKDAVVAVMALCEAAAYYREQGLTLCDQMKKLYDTYGYYLEDLCTITLKGQEGLAEITRIMESIRKNPPKNMGEYRVVQFTDYEQDTNLPKSNVLYLELERDAWCCIRPSGTEPKIKFYMGVKEESMEESKRLLEVLKDAMYELVEKA